VSIDPQTVRHVAHLAHLAVSDSEVESLATDLSSLLDYVERITTADVSDQPIERDAMRRRPDTVVNTDAERVMAAAPEVERGLVSVPKLLTAEDTKELVDFTAFQALDIRTALILTAGRHPKADRLLVLTVDVGELEPRTVVAGLAEHYPEPEVLVGKTVLAVCNLKPAKLRGIESTAMLLAAGGKTHRGLATVAEPGRAGQVVR